MGREVGLPIGALASRTGTKVNTIRFYEDIGLLPHAARTVSGRRSYGPEDVRRLSFIRSARGLGFSIDEIRSLTALAAGPEQDCAEVRALAARHLLAVDERLARMAQLRCELARIVELCDGGRVSECRVIEAIEAAPTSAG
ncbi:MAG: transcriptional regulator [Alphaproteobacteria bacterium HGW-Alphaproteobacteria-17]|nr:MAG: transcriptional regulator [Alphaproteobacteria bacterium HGW-Alphaproteobacteria-17]